MKEKWLLEIEVTVDQEGEPQEVVNIEGVNNHITLEKEGVTRWWYGAPTVIIPWELVKRYAVKEEVPT